MRPTFDELLIHLEDKERKLQEAKTVLEAVEEAMKNCEGCCRRYDADGHTLRGIYECYEPDSDGRTADDGCPLAPIRRAWRKP